MKARSELSELLDGRFEPNASREGQPDGTCDIPCNGVEKTLKTTPKINPKAATIADEKTAKPNRLMHYGMMACCAVMLLPVGLYFAAGGTVSGALESAGLFAPLIACVGMHLVMHRMMGKSCHGKKEEAEPSEVPLQPDRTLAAENVRK